MQRIVDFVLELDRLKAVTRKIRLRTTDRYENSAEHSWQLALLALSLARYAPPGVDMDRVVRMLLVHDVCEIDAGDVIAFAEQGWEEQREKELAGVTRVFALLPREEGGAFLSLWKEFDAASTPEARFARAVDRAMPVLQNLANDGQSWRENGISHARVVKRVQGEIAAGCPALWAYLEPRLEEARAHGWFGG